MKKMWDVNVNGTVHKIGYKRRGKIMVNGEEYKAKSMNWWVHMVDYPIRIEDTEIRVVAIGNKVDLAVNGVYLGSGEKYTPLHKMPVMANVFMGISCVGGFLLCGIIGMMIGVLFSILYAKKGLEGNKNALIGAFVGCTVIQAIICIIFAVFYVFSSASGLI